MHVKRIKILFVCDDVHSKVRMLNSNESGRKLKIPTWVYRLAMSVGWKTSVGTLGTTGLQLEAQLARWDH